jgi:hypothetical protein
MDFHSAVKVNLSALKQIVLTLVAMVGSGTVTLPRHAFNAARRLLRPAESAAQRLIIAAAKDIVVTLPEPKTKTERVRELTTKQKIYLLRRRRLARDRACYWRPKKRPKKLTFSLLDPAYRPFRKRRRTIPDHKAPRIRSLFAPTLPYRPASPPLRPQPPSPGDPVNAERLRQRIAILAAALDDIPGQAKRFATWRARVARRKAAAEAQPSATAGRVRWVRDWPLRLGRPYACRLIRWDPDAPRAKNIREIDEILARAHTLALDALDTS